MEKIRRLNAPYQLAAYIPIQNKPWLVKTSGKKPIEKLGSMPFETGPLFRISKWDLNNAPAEIVNAAEVYGKSVESFWCYLHGQFFTKYKIHLTEHELIHVDYENCQCAECERLGIASTSTKIRK
ncbi:TPA: hypothetical protein ACX6NV_000586 [Photobacterium damselae]